VICRRIELMHSTRARQGDVVPVEAMNLALDGKRALVTGSSAGIGAAIAKPWSTRVRRSSFTAQPGVGRASRRRGKRMVSRPTSPTTLTSPG
jgi:hypothetical protein